MNKRFLKTISGILVAAMLSSQLFCDAYAEDFSANEEVIIEEPEEIEIPIDETTEENPEVIEEPEEIIEEPEEKPKDEPKDDIDFGNEIYIPDEEPIGDDQTQIAEEMSASDNEIESLATDSYSYAEIMANDIGDFPESYRNGLSKIQSAHPNWKFVRVNTGLDWESVVENEMSGDRSVIWYTANTKYRSNKMWGETGKWYYASKEGVEHFLDPRVSLDETHIFMHEKLSYESSYQTLSNVQKICDGTFMKGAIPNEKDYSSYAEALHHIGSGIGISPIHLAARIIREQGINGSDMVSGKVPGFENLYNYYNIQAKGDGKQAITTGLKYAQDQGWNTRYRALKGGAEFIYKGYINIGQNTPYLEKWDVVKTSPSSPYYTHQYMQDIQAPYGDAEKAYSSYKSAGILNKDFIFFIPVYNNMPNSTDTGKTDPSKEIELTDLKSISILETAPELKAGQDMKLTLNTVPANANPAPEITWKSSNESIATVDFNGKITAHKAGSVTISAETDSADKKVGTNGHLTAQVNVTVKKVTINYRDLNGDIIRSRDDALIGKPIGLFPYSSSECFPESAVTGLDENIEVLGGWYSGKDRSGVRVDENTLIEKDLDIYPFILKTEKFTFDVKPVGDFTYTGTAIKPEPEVYYGGIKLIKGKDYTVSYSYNRNVNADADGKQLSNATVKPTVTVKGKGNFTGSQFVQFNIKQADIENASAEDIVVDYKATTKPVYADPVVYYGNIKLKKNVDYTLDYPRMEGNLEPGNNNYGAYIVPGIYPIVISGKGAYFGSKTVYEVVSKRVNVSKLKFKTKKVIYNGSNYSVNDLVSNGYLSIMNKDVPVRIFDSENMAIDSTDWDVKVELPDDMKNIGSKKVVVYGNSKCGYSGNKVLTLKIAAPSSKIELTALSGMPGTVIVSGVNSTPYEFEKGGVKPKVSVVLADGTKLTEYLDYTVAYKNNTKVVSNNPPSVVITGKGAYKGKVIVTFSMVATDINNCIISAVSPEYRAKKGGYKAELSIFDNINGNILKAGADYAKLATYSYAEDTLVQDITDKSNPQIVTRRAGELVKEMDIPSAGARLTVSVNGIGNYKGSISEDYTIKAKSISKAKVFVASKEYTGDPIYLLDKDVTVILDNEILASENYEIIAGSYSNNVDKGTASVYIRGKGNYGGTKKLTYKITALPILWYFNK